MSLVPQLVEQIDARIAELEPLVDELDKLRRLRDGMTESSPPPTQRASRAARTVRSGRTPSRPAPPPVDQADLDQRSQQALELIAAQPGITSAEVAEALDAEPAAAYRLLPALIRSRQIVRRGAGYAVAVPQS